MATRKPDTFAGWLGTLQKVAAQKGAPLHNAHKPRPTSIKSARPGLRARRASPLARSLRSFAAAAARHRASQPFAADQGESPFGQMQDLIPPNIPVGEAMGLLAGLLVRCVDSANPRATQELMKHELFNSRTLEAVVHYARRESESMLAERINELHTQIAEMTEQHDILQAHLAVLQAEQRERQEQAKQKRRKAIKPAQAARLAGATNTKISAELTRRRRNGEDIQGRHVCSEIAARLGVTADHVRKVKRNWLSGLKHEKRD